MDKISWILKKINEINYNQGIFILKLRCKKKILTIINAILLLSLAISTYFLKNLSEFFYTANNKDNFSYCFHNSVGGPMNTRK